MRTGTKLMIGALAGAGALWGARAWLRARRRIELIDRVVVITGGSTGLGYVLARQAAEAGAIVVIAARESAELRAAEAELRARSTRDVMAMPTDVQDQGQVETLIARTVERFGRVDVLVNNAGTIVVGPVEAMTVQDFRHAMATNYWGAVYASLAAMPHMKQQGFGRIANIGSLGAKVAAPHLLPYTASKFALAGFSEGLRAELARDNILVTAIHPGLIHTGGHAHALFKGAKQAEYSWFSLADVTPGVAVPVERVARAVWEAVRVGDPEALVGWTAHLPVAFHKLFPDWFAETMALVDMTLPPSVNLGEPATRGEQLRGAIPDVLNRAVPDAARPGPNPA